MPGQGPVALRISQRSTSRLHRKDLDMLSWCILMFMRFLGKSIDKSISARQGHGVRPQLSHGWRGVLCAAEIQADLQVHGMHLSYFILLGSLFV